MINYLTMKTRKGLYSSWEYKGIADEVTATVRENFWIKLLDTRRNGLNSNKS